MANEGVPKLTTYIGPSSWAREEDDKIRFTRSSTELYTQSLDISFQRTVRVADIGKTNDLPPSLGSFPIYKTTDYEDKLPKHMAGKPGYFIPMYRKYCVTRQVVSTWAALLTRYRA